MFEQTLIPVGRTKRPWAVVAAFGLQLTIVGILLVIPMLFVESLPIQAYASNSKVTWLSGVVSMTAWRTSVGEAAQLSPSRLSLGRELTAVHKEPAFSTNTGTVKPWSRSTLPTADLKIRVRSAGSKLGRVMASSLLVWSAVIRRSAFTWLWMTANKNSGGAGSGCSS